MSSRSGAVFWALVLIILGGIFLLQNTGVLPRDIGGTIWPVLLIALGAWLIVRPNR